MLVHNHLWKCQCYRYGRQAYLLLKSLNRQSILFLKPLIIYFYYVYIVSMNRALEYFIDNKASIVYCIFILLIPLTMPLFAPFECPHMYCIINYNCVCKLFLSTYLPLYYIKQVGIYTLDTFFCQIKSFRRFRLAFGFGLQTFYLIIFSQIYRLNGLKPKNKG